MGCCRFTFLSFAIILGGGGGEGTSQQKKIIPDLDVLGAFFFVFVQNHRVTSNVLADTHGLVKVENCSSAAVCGQGPAASRDRDSRDRPYEDRQDEHGAVNSPGARATSFFCVLQGVFTPWELIFMTGTFEMPL